MSPTPDAPSPPRWLVPIVRRCVPAEDRATYLGDLHERFIRRSRHGLTGARWWYLKETLRIAWLSSGDRLDVVTRLRPRAAGSPSSTARSSIVSRILFDVQLGIRSLVRRPTQHLPVVLTMALGVGMTTAMFSVVDGVLLRPLPYPEPDDLVLVYEVDERPGTLNDRNLVTAATYGDWRTMNRVFDGMANFFLSSMLIRPERGPAAVDGGWVGADFFDLMAVPPLLGRGLGPQDGLDDSRRVAVVGHDFWQNDLGGNPDVIGTMLPMSSGVAREIVGVMPDGFSFLDREIDVWVPWILSPSALQNRRSHSMRVVARVKDGLSPSTAQDDMDRVSGALRDRYPEFLTGWSVNVVPLTTEIVGPIRPALILLFGAVSLLLLTGAVNLGGLLLSRSMSEEAVVAIRVALGAGRATLVRAKLAELGVFAAISAVAGLGLSSLAIKLLVANAPPELPRVEQIHLNGAVLLFALGVTVVTILLAGIGPVLRAASAAGTRRIGDVTRSGTASRRTVSLHSAFATTQLALSLILVVSAGLMLNAFARLISVDTGYTTGETAVLKINLPSAGYAGVPEQRDLLATLLPQLAARPEVHTASLTNLLPLVDFESTWSVQIVGKPDAEEGEKRDYGWHAVSHGYIETMGINLVRGRLFDEFDTQDARPVAVVNTAFVQRFFEDGESPLGKSFFVITADSVPREIVGVIESVRHYDLSEDPRPAYYTPFPQVPDTRYWLGQMNVVLHPTRSATDALSAASQVIRQTDPQILITGMSTMGDHLARSVARERFTALVLNAFAMTALALAVVGVYGVTAVRAARERPAIGVRLALGATPAQVIGGLVAVNARFILLAVVAGLAGAAAFTRVQSGLLFGVSPLDPLTYLAAAGLLAVVAISATLWPAIRASRVDPVTVLRGE